MSRENQQLYVATRKGLFTLERHNQGAWEISKSHFLGDPVSIVMVDPRDQTVYAALGHGHFGVKLHRSDNGGVTWNACDTPKYPEKPADIDDRDGMGRAIPWNVEQIWALAAGHPSKPQELWCGTIPGGLFHSQDRGDSWQLNHALWHHPKRKEWFGGGADHPGIHSICVDPEDPQRILVGVSCGGVWLTRDGGESWTCCSEGMRAAYMPPERQQDPYIQDPHCVVQCPGQPKYFWAQHHNGIFHSQTRGQSWTEITDVPPSSFGFATAVHPRDPHTAWFIPAIKDEQRIPVDGKLVVVRTKDGGKSFTVHRHGLPQTHAYDLVFRHALAIDHSGEWLAFGSTTGNLWVSEDQGETWQNLSCHLPPIYCVRFA